MYIRALERQQLALYDQSLPGAVTATADEDGGEVTTTSDLRNFVLKTLLYIAMSF